MSTEEDIDEPIDPNEPRYCICNQVAYGTMVACDNKGVIRKKYFNVVKYNYVNIFCNKIINIPYILVYL